MSDLPLVVLAGAGLLLNALLLDCGDDGAGGHWLRVELVDPAPDTGDRGGASVVLHDRWTLVHPGPDAAPDLLFSLGDERPRSLEVRWPDPQGTVSVVEVTGLVDGTVTVSKRDGLVGWSRGER